MTDAGEQRLRVPATYLYAQREANQPKLAAAYDVGGSLVGARAPRWLLWLRPRPLPATSFGAMPTRIELIEGALLEAHDAGDISQEQYFNALQGLCASGCGQRRAQEGGDAGLRSSDDRFADDTCDASIAFTATDGERIDEEGSLSPLSHRPSPCSPCCPRLSSAAGPTLESQPHCASGPSSSPWPLEPGATMHHDQLGLVEVRASSLLHVAPLPPQRRSARGCTRSRA